MLEQEIIEILSNLDKPAKSSIEINDELGLTSIADYKNLEKTLEEMTSKGILYYSEKKKRYLLLKNSHLMKGKLLVNPKGFGFVEIGEGKKDVYIGRDNLNNARHLDIVLFELLENKTEGRIVKIIERNEDGISNIDGIYPCGEGAGYAGGIVSAAVDGIRCAHAVLVDESDEW